MEKQRGREDHFQGFLFVHRLAGVRFWQPTGSFCVRGSLAWFFQGNGFCVLANFVRPFQILQSALKSRMNAGSILTPCLFSRCSNNSAAETFPTSAIARRNSSIGFIGILQMIRWSWGRIGKCTRSSSMSESWREACAVQHGADRAAAARFVNGAARGGYSACGGEPAPAAYRPSGISAGSRHAGIVYRDGGLGPRAAVGRHWHCPRVRRRRHREGGPTGANQRPSAPAASASAPRPAQR